MLTQTFTEAEIHGLRRAGVDLEVVSCRPGEIGPPSDVPVRALPGPTGLRALRALLGWAVRRPLTMTILLLTVATARYRDQPLRCWARGFLQLSWAAQLASDLRKKGERPHLHAQFVDAASTVAWAAARLIGTTFSFTNHTAYNPYLLRPKLRDAAVVFSISRFDREHMLRMAGRVDADNVRVVYQGIDAATFEIAPRTARGDPLEVLCVAALREKKGVDVLLRAFRLVLDQGVRARLIVVGDGPERDRLEALIGELDLASAVELPGAESPEAVRVRLGRADLFVLACRKARNGDLDGVPISLMEAMAAGVPVVSTRISGVPELIEDGVEGLLAPVDDVDGLAEHILRLALAPEEAAEFSARAREKILRQHDLAASTRMVADALSEVVR